MRKLVLSFIFLVLVIPSLSGAAAPRVLFLSSYHPGFPTFFTQVQGLKEVLDPAGVTMDVEFMDSKRLFDEENFANFTRLLRHKLEQVTPYDVLVVGDDNALNYAVEHREDLFKGLPMVFLGINDMKNGKELAKKHGLTGVLEKVSMEQTIVLMRGLLPKMRNIVLVTDNTVTARPDTELFKRVMKLRGDRQYSILDLSLVHWADVPSIIKRIPRSDAILLLAPYRDMNGVTKSWDEGLKVISENADCPVFHIWDHGVGQGLVGGKVVSFREHGRLAGELALKIINGIPPASLPLIEGGEANIILFDWTQLKRFGVPKSRLPEESVILNYTPTFLEDNRAILVELGGIILILVVVITYLLRANRAKTGAEARALSNEKRYRTYMESAPVGVFVFDQDGIVLETNDAMLELAGYSMGEAVGMSVLDLLSEESREKARLKLAGEMRSSDYATSYEILRKDGSTVFVSFHGVLLEDGSILGFCKDLSREKEAHDALEKKEALFRGLLEQAGDAVIVCEKNGKILFANDMACHSLGYTRGELLSCMIWEIDPLAADGIGGAKSWPQPSDSIESELIRKDGSRFPVEVKVGRIDVGGEEVYLGLVREIAARKVLECRRTLKLEASQAYVEIFKALSAPDTTIRTVARDIYDWALRLTGSSHAYVGSLDPGDKSLHLYHITDMQRDGCRIKSPQVIFPKTEGRYPSLWGDSLNTGKPLVTNFPVQHPMSTGLPEGHVSVERFMAVPCWYEGEVVGQIGLANAKEEYTDDDLVIVENLANLFALAIYRKRVEAELVQARKVKWY